MLFVPFRTFRGPNATPTQRAAIESLVHRLLAERDKGHGPPVTAWEQS